MAIAFDAASTVASNSTLSHTVTGSNPFLIVHTESPNDGDTITGATYNSVAMTLLGKSNIAASVWDYAFYLFNPSTGTHNVDITKSGGAAQYIAAASYTGILSTTPDNTGTSTGTGTTSDFANSITSVANNCWHIGSFGCSTGRPFLAGTGTTRRTTGGDSNNGWFIGDNNAAITPAASNTINAKLTAGSGGAVFFGITISPTAPAVATGGFFLAASR